MRRTADGGGAATGRPRRGRRRRPDAAAGSRASGIAASRFRRARSANFSRRNNTNYMQTGVLSGLQLTVDVPEPRLENFYRRRRTRSRPGKTEAPYGFVIPVQRDMTRVAELVNILRAQRIEVGQATAEIKVGDGTFPAGSYVIKRDQPYGRLAKNLLEKQNYPDPEPPTYDDSGWTMGLAMLVDVKEIKDKAILDVADDAGQRRRRVKGKVTGSGHGRPRRRALRLEQHDRVPLQAAERADEDRREELHGRRRGVPGRLVRDRAAGRPGGGARGGRAARPDRGGALGRCRPWPMHDADAAAHRDLLVVERHAGDRLVPVHASTSSAFRST